MKSLSIIIFTLFIVTFLTPVLAHSGERTEMDALRDLKKGAGYLGAAVVCKEYGIAGRANSHLKYLQARDVIAGILKHEDEAFLIQLQKETSQRVSEAFLSENPPFSCSELLPSFESFVGETRNVRLNEHTPSPGVTDYYTTLKNKPAFSKLLDDVRNNRTSTQDTGRSLGWADSMVKSWPSIALTIGVTFMIFIARLSENRKGSEGILTRDSKFKWYVLAGLSFILLRGFLDTHIGITTDNALNLLFGLLGIGCVMVPLFLPKHIAKLLPIAGWWMLGRGVLNIMLFIIATDDVGEFIVTMPISALPNIAISYVLPIVIGAYFLRLHRDRKRADF